MAKDPICEMTVDETSALHAERNIRTIAELGLHFAPLERDRFAFARSIDMSSLRDEEDCLEKPCQKNEKLIACFQRSEKC